MSLGHPWHSIRTLFFILRYPLYPSLFFSSYHLWPFYILCICLLVYCWPPCWNDRSWVNGIFFSMKHLEGLEQGLTQRRHEIHIKWKKEEMNNWGDGAIPICSSPLLFYTCPMTTEKKSTAFPNICFKWFYITGIRIC